MKELWQLYNEQGQPLPGEGADKDTVFSEGLLHSASHVWIWRVNEMEPEVLLQRRAETKRTWPGLLDISAAGHVDLGEDPLTAAVREAAEEIGVEVNPARLALIGVYRSLMEDGEATENEFQWMYLLRQDEHQDLTLQTIEVGSTSWKPLRDFGRETLQDETPDGYVPHGRSYFQIVYDAISTTA